MAWEGLTEDEKAALTEYLQCFRNILDEVSDYCEANEVQIISAGVMLDFGAAYANLAGITGLGNPFERYLNREGMEQDEK